MVRVVCSMTTIPSRMNHIYPALQRLHSQTVPFDAIYLTLPRISARSKEVYPDPPDSIKRLCTVVKVKKDYGPVTKIVGGLMMESDPHTIIITCDDDVIYPTTLVSELLKYHNRYPKSAIGSAGLSIGYFPFYWSLAYNQKKDSKWFHSHIPKRGKKIDILYGYAGVLYVRGFFPFENIDRNFLSYTTASTDLFLNDDVLISCYLNSKGIERRICPVSDVSISGLKNGLADNGYIFVNSLRKAIKTCRDLGWFKEYAEIDPTNTFGFLTIFIFLVILIVLVLLMTSYNKVYGN